MTAGPSTSTGADPAVVGPYLARVLDDPSWQTCDVALIAGGKSNLTYVVRSTTAAEVVLRRPPLGSVLPTAHDMMREHRVIASLGGTPVPVPDALHLCQDDSVLGAPFYVMSRVEGPVVRDAVDLTGYADDVADRRRIGEAVLDVLADLHAVDPAAVGLADFGRPEGYLERQVRRWVRQWEASRAVDLPALDRLAADLAAALPASRPEPASKAGTVVHGDYRLDNTILDPAAPGRVAAVLDWEMSTLGDPLADLGLLLVYWAQAGDETRRATTRVVPAATVAPGFPTRREVAERYAARTGRSLDALPWYVAFGFFKLAVVVAGITARVRAGAMVGDGFEGIEATMEPLVDLGRATLAAGEVA